MFHRFFFIGRVSALSLTQRKYRLSATNLLQSLNASSFGVDEKGVDAENIFMADHTKMNMERCKGTKNVWVPFMLNCKVLCGTDSFWKSICLVMAWRRSRQSITWNNRDSKCGRPFRTTSKIGRSPHLVAVTWKYKKPCYFTIRWRLMCAYVTDRLFIVV